MLKDYLSKNNITVYKLAKAIEEPYSTVNDLSNGKICIDDCRVNLLRKIAGYFNISLEEMYKECQNIHYLYSEKYSTHGVVEGKKKKYIISFDYDNTHHEVEFCKITEHSTMFIKEAALYEMEKMISQMELEKTVCNIF